MELTAALQALLALVRVVHLDIPISPLSESFIDI